MEFQDTEDRGTEVSLARKAGRMGRLIHRYYSINARNKGAIGDPLRGQGRVLALLAVKPETTQRELSFLLDMRQQSLSELLAKLEEKGYITREKSEQDGRVTVVRLTDEGAAAAPSPDEMGKRADALDCLTDEEREQFEQMVDKVIESLERKLVDLGDDPYAPPHMMHDHDDRGPRGDRDDRGFRGERGPRGDREDRGPRGPRDDRGFRGERGPRGPRGDHEPHGDRGPRGDRDRGPRDDRGFRGGRGQRDERRDGHRGPRNDREDHSYRGVPNDRPRGERRGWSADDDHLHQA